jgi:hypothetical protein
VAIACSDQLSELRLPGPREGLAGHAACHELNMIDAPPVELLEQIARITEITDVPEPAKVGRMRLYGPRIDVCSH